MDFGALSNLLKENGTRPGAPATNLNRGPTASSASSSKPSTTPAELSQHADHMWRFLDELAASDPEAYKKFIAQQMAEVAEEKKKKAESEALFTPQPAYVIYTRQMKPTPERTIYLNICSSTQIPPLQTKDKQPAKGHEPMSDILIPLSVGAIKEDTYEGKQVFTTDIVFHPTVVSRSTTDLSFKLFMLELALQHVEEDEKVILHRGYKFESPNKKYIGSTSGPQQQKTESELEREKFVAKMKAEREEKIKNMKTNKTSEIVMPSLSKTNQAKEQFEAESLKELKLRPESSATSTAGGKNQPVKKKVLIEDLTPDQGEDESLKETISTTKPAPVNSSKPAISLASTSKPSTTAALSSSSKSATTTAASSTSSSTASASVSNDFISEPAYTSKSSTAISGDDFLSKLSSIPVDHSSSNSWPYGSSSASMQSTASINTPFNKPKVTPVHSVTVANGQLQITIHLPEVVSHKQLISSARNTSVSEVELDVSRQQLKLSSLKYDLQLTLPHPIQDESSSAKFVKSKNTLKISAPIRVD